MKTFKQFISEGFGKTALGVGGAIIGAAAGYHAYKRYQGRKMLHQVYDQVRKPPRYMVVNRRQEDGSYKPSEILVNNRSDKAKLEKIRAGIIQRRKQS